jgi:hypothetical protein
LLSLLVSSSLVSEVVGAFHGIHTRKKSSVIVIVYYRRSHYRRDLNLPLS